MSIQFFLDKFSYVRGFKDEITSLKTTQRGLRSLKKKSENKYKILKEEISIANKCSQTAIKRLKTSLEDRDQKLKVINKKLKEYTKIYKKTLQ